MSPLFAVPGFLALCFFALWAVRALQSERTPYRNLAPWGVLALYVGASAVITAAGRVGFGMEHALTSRYTTITNLFWIAIAGLLVAHPPLNTGTRTQQRVATMLSVPLVVVLLLCVSVSQRGWEEIALWKRMSWQGIRAGFEAPLFLFDLSDRPEALKKQDLPFLREAGLAGMDVPAEEVKASLDPGAYLEQAKVFASRGMTRPAQTYLQAAHFLAPENKTLQKEIGGIMNNLGPQP
jgi:hypothetical protein